MRTSGILLPIFSLPSRYGIGTLGKEAYRFVDFLVDAGQSYWQILPLNPTDLGDSPYQSFSSTAGNPYFIDLAVLCEKGLLKSEECDRYFWGNNPLSVDYSRFYTDRMELLRTAFCRFDRQNEDFIKFVKENPDLAEYALFSAIKKSQNGMPWYLWDAPLRDRNGESIADFKQSHRDEIEFVLFTQFEFWEQWRALKAYANGKGIKIIGDMPIYVSADSADVWCNRKMFRLLPDGRPQRIAGCPPDGFSDEGQLWGTPVYDWEYMKNEPVPYSFWRKRILYALTVYDTLRLDHFRGFEAYFSVDSNQKTAKNGVWTKGPGIELFRLIEKDLKKKPDIIAEDLGFLTSEVHKLRDDCGFPGMRVLQFAFDGDKNNVYLPHNFCKNTVAYTGTHDNDTVVGWVEKLPAETRKYLLKYLGLSSTDGINWHLIRLAMSSVADTVIIPFFDYIGAGSEGRINTPGTVGNNWNARIDGGCINSWLANIIRETCEVFGRAK